jgi:hypothetical protein
MSILNKFIPYLKQLQMALLPLVEFGTELTKFNFNEICFQPTAFLTNICLDKNRCSRLGAHLAQFSASLMLIFVKYVFYNCHSIRVCFQVHSLTCLFKNLKMLSALNIQVY